MYRSSTNKKYRPIPKLFRICPSRLWFRFSCVQVAKKLAPCTFTRCGHSPCRVHRNANNISCIHRFATVCTALRGCGARIVRRLCLISLKSWLNRAIVDVLLPPEVFTTSSLAPGITCVTLCWEGQGMQDMDYLWTCIHSVFILCCTQQIATFLSGVLFGSVCYRLKIS